MTFQDNIGDRMKNNYENISKTKLMRRTPVALRLDGKAFHSFTRGFEKPFDEVLGRTMRETMKYLAIGDTDKTFAARDALIDYITLNEHKVQKHFDVFHFIVLTKRMFNLEKRLDMLD